MAFCRRGDYNRHDGYVIRPNPQDERFGAKVKPLFQPKCSRELMRMVISFCLQSQHGRPTPLRAALSLDGGMTFPLKQDIIQLMALYLSTALQTPDGRIIMFTSNDRTTIRLATLRNLSAGGD